MKAYRPDSSLDAIDTAASAWIIRRDAGLSAAEEAEFERWRCCDPRHAAALAAHEQAWSTLDRPRQAGEGGFMRLAYQARTARRRRKRAGAAAALLSVVFVVGIIAWQDRPDTVSVASAASKTARVVVPTRQILADGSRVDLRSGTEIAVAFEPRIRRVSLQKGEAHFEVAKHSERPFVVAVAGMEVVAVGTAFSVQLGARETAVVVTEGRVAIEPQTHGSKLAARIYVDAGHRLVVPVDASTLAEPAVSAISPLEIDKTLGWRKAHIEFTDTSLGEAVVILNQYAAPYGQTRLAIEDPAVAAVLVTGYFRADSLDAFVRLMEASAGIKAERSGDTITLRDAR